MRASAAGSWSVRRGPGSVLAVIFQAGVNINTNTAAVVLAWSWKGALRWPGWGWGGEGKGEGGCKQAPYHWFIFPAS